MQTDAADGAYGFPKFPPPAGQEIHFFTFSIKNDQIWTQNDQQCQNDQNAFVADHFVLHFFAFVAGKNGAGQELSCKNGAGQKKQNKNRNNEQFKLVGNAALMGVFLNICLFCFH